MSDERISRVRHELRRRTLTITAVEALTPGMLRLHFASSDLDDFPSVGFDDHIKLFIPGTAAGEGERGTMRDFTPRRFDRAGGTIALDFALHAAGPAIDWARAAAVGDTVQIGGPRGSMVIADVFDWYWLIGDETALPAIGRRLEELRASVPVTSVVVVNGVEERQQMTVAADWTAHWPMREGGDDAARLIAVIDTLPIPSGEGFVWIAAEASVARAVRAAVEAKGQPRRWIKAAGYWQRGDAGVHVRIED